MQVVELIRRTADVHAPKVVDVVRDIGPLIDGLPDEDEVEQCGELARLQVEREAKAVEMDEQQRGAQRTQESIREAIWQVAADRIMM